MPEVPGYQSLMLPLLRLCSDGEISLARCGAKARAALQSDTGRGCSEAASGQLVIYNRTGWAKTELSKAGLIEQPRRGIFRITARGRELIATAPQAINRAFLVQRYPEFRAYIEASQRRAATPSTQPEPSSTTSEERLAELAATTRTPSEQIDLAVAQIEAQLRDELLDRIFVIEDLTQRAAFFEDLVVTLVKAMGYGEGLDDAGGRTGGAGDGGVDGVIYLDALGIDRVYVQAKCYDRSKTIQPGQVRDFSGSLDDKKTSRGVFITTATFTDAARTYVQGIQKQIVLIDGEELAQTHASAQCRCTARQNRLH